MKKDYSFEYMLLGRLKNDCEVYINSIFSNKGNPKRLWAKNEHEQIKEMFRLYDLLPVKPEWLTLEGIKEYARRMNVDTEMKRSLQESENSAKENYTETPYKKTGKKYHPDAVGVIAYTVGYPTPEYVQFFDKKEFLKECENELKKYEDLTALLLSDDIEFQREYYNLIYGFFNYNYEDICKQKSIKNKTKTNSLTPISDNSKKRITLPEKGKEKRGRGV